MRENDEARWEAGMLRLWLWSGVVMFVGLIAAVVLS